MGFEYDETKSRSNLEKHGIDFAAAQGLRQDPGRIVVPTRSPDEPRWVVIAEVGGKRWSAVVTEREGRTRIISVRRSRDEEKKIYEG